MTDTLIPSRVVRAATGLNDPAFDKLARLYGIGSLTGSGNPRTYTPAEAHAVAVYRLVRGSDLGGAEWRGQRRALIDSVITAALENPDARFIVAHPDWWETCSTAEEVVAVHARRGGVCTVIDTFFASGLSTHPTPQETTG